MWVIFRRARFPFFKDPLGFLFAYGALGVIVSFILSTDPWRASYWAGIYLAPLMVFWMVYMGEDALHRLKVIINVNYFVFFALTFSLLPSALRVGRGLAPEWQYYNLPLGLGEVNRNGVGRYALIVIIVSGVRLISQKSIGRWFWLLTIGPAAYLLAQTESRTSLLGLAVIVVLFFLLKGINMKFLILAPAAFSLIYTVGFRTRAHGNLNQLIYLTGRENAWNLGIRWIKESPLLGWGFHADRIMMNNLHMHNSYLHSAIQEGLVGALLFLGAFIGIWAMMLWKNVFKVSRNLEGQDQVLLMESVLIVAFLTSRSFFESTAAFYGVDLLLIIPAMAFISMMLRDPGAPDTEPEAIA
jgi:O-antigen ligase